MAARSSRRSRQAGVSLVEALVALAVMSLGMLALVGVQSTMRFNNDLSKQRGEATRIAHEELERLRVFLELGAIAGQPNRSWDEIASTTATDYAAQGGIGNVTYRVQRTVNRLPASATGVTAAGQQKVVRVQVQWTDRTGTAQTLTVETVIGGAAPALSALLTAPPLASAATTLVNGRHHTIPSAAADQGDGSSRLVPGGASGIAWYFDNTSGQLRVCDSAGSNCQIALLVAGRIGFLPGPAQDLATAPGALALSRPFSADPLPTVSCYGPNLAPASNAIDYVCAVVPAIAAGWGGKLDVALASGTGRKVCRYTTGTTDYTANRGHPRTYCMETAPAASPVTACSGQRVSGNLIHQNFVVVDAADACPSGTLLHQSAP